MPLLRSILFLLALSSFACSQTTSNRTVTPSGNFYQWDAHPDGRYQLKWGNASFEHTFASQFDSAEAFPAFIGENKDVIVLEGSCGRYCGYAVILPLNKTASAVRYDQPFDIDAKRNLIVISCDMEVGPDTALVVRNYVTGESQFLVAPHWNDSEDWTRRANIQGDSVRYEWQYSGSIPKSITVLLKVGLRK